MTLFMRLLKCKFDYLFFRTLCMPATCDVRHFLLLFAITLYHHKEAVGLSPEVLESSCARDLGTDLWELRQSLHLLNFSPFKLESQSLQFTKLFNLSLWLAGIISSRLLPRRRILSHFLDFCFQQWKVNVEIKLISNLIQLLKFIYSEKATKLCFDVFK